jgi:hypothetical protein
MIWVFGNMRPDQPLALHAESPSCISSPLPWLHNLFTTSYPLSLAPLRRSVSGEGLWGLEHPPKTVWHNSQLSS